MVQLSDEQVDLILQRIVHDEVTDPDLQNGLLDHYCCYIEEQMDNGQDFETAYNTAFLAISPNGMHEIQEELFFLLTFKKQTTMKRLALGSGIFAAIVLSFGIMLKFLHMPGASVCIVLGVGILSLIFLPMLFMLKIKEKNTTNEKLLIGLGILSAILMSLSVLFLVMHWPGALKLGYSTVTILILLYLPIFLMANIRRAETRVNGIVTGVLLIAGCGLWLTLVASPKSVKTKNVRNTYTFLRNEQILKTEKQLAIKENGAAITSTLAQNIYNRCESLKVYLVEKETGFKSIDQDFETKNILLTDDWIDNYFAKNPDAMKQLFELKKIIEQYNTTNATQPGVMQIPVAATVVNFTGDKTIDVLNDFIRVQMIILQNERIMTTKNNG